VYDLIGAETEPCVLAAQRVQFIPAPSKAQADASIDRDRPSIEYAKPHVILGKATRTRTRAPTANAELQAVHQRADRVRIGQARAFTSVVGFDGWQ
jgi:hypothetical protein